MAFVPFLILALFLYARGYKVVSLIIFFFFVTSGFQLIEDEVFDLGIGISKGSDLAFFAVLGCLVMDVAFNKGYLRSDSFTKVLFLFFCYLFIQVLYSRFVVGLSWSEIIRTSRAYIFWLTYFIFRNMDVKDLERLLNCIFVITVILSFIYLLQILIGESILNHEGSISYKIFGYELKRFYNQPHTIQFITLMAIYKNPLKGLPRLIATFILIVALLGAFHRSLTGCFVFVILLGYVLRLPNQLRVRVIILSLAVLIPSIAFIGHRFVQSRTYADMQAVVAGDFTEIDYESLELFQNSTFAFRMGHVYERILYLEENPPGQIIGTGLIAEYSPAANQKFNFLIGLSDNVTGAAVQIETSDISYSPLLLRIGFLGTGLYLLLYISMLIFFFKRKDNEYAFFSFLFIIMALLLSFFSGNLTMPPTYLLLLISYNIVKKQDVNYNGLSSRN